MACAAKVRIDAGSCMSTVSDFMPGFAAVVSSRACRLRPAMMTWLPSDVEGFSEAAANAGAAASDQDRVAAGIHSWRCL